MSKGGVALREELWSRRMDRTGDIIQTEQNHGAAWGETVVMRFGPPREADGSGDAGFGGSLVFRAVCQRHAPVPVSLLT